MSYADYLKSKGLSLAGADNETPAQAAKQVYQPSTTGGFNTGYQQQLQGIASSDPYGQPSQSVVGEPGGEWLGRQLLDAGATIQMGLNNLYSDPTSQSFYDNDPMGVLAMTAPQEANKALRAKERNTELQADIDFREDEADWKNQKPEWKKQGLSEEEIEAMRPTRDSYGNSENQNKASSTIDTTANNNALYGRDDTELTDRQAFDRWYAQKQLDNPDLTYDSFEDFQFNGSANDWLDFMLDADTWAPGMYTDYLQNSLGDSYGFSREDAEALAAAQALYSDYVTDWRSNHTAAGLLNDSQIAAEILGGYYNNDAQYNALIDYLASMYPTGNYTDANGQMYYDFANLDDNSRAMLNQMFANSSLQGLLGSNISESQLDALGSLYDQYDYALADNGTYTAAGMDPYRDELQSYVATANLMDPSLYLAANGSPSQGAMSQLVLADALGYGSNQNFTEEQWKNAFGL